MLLTQSFFKWTFRQYLFSKYICNLYSTLAIYNWDWRRTSGYERSISETVHWLALWCSVCAYHVTTGRVRFFTLHCVNPEFSTFIEQSHNCPNTWVSISGSAINTRVVTLFTNVFFRFSGIDWKWMEIL